MVILVILRYTTTTLANSPDNPIELYGDTYDTPDMDKRVMIYLSVENFQNNDTCVYTIRTGRDGVKELNTRGEASQIYRYRFIYGPKKALDSTFPHYR